MRNQRFLFWFLVIVGTGLARPHSAPAADELAPTSLPRFVLGLPPDVTGTLPVEAQSDPEFQAFFRHFFVLNENTQLWELRDHHAGTRRTLGMSPWELYTELNRTLAAYRPVARTILHFEKVLLKGVVCSRTVRATASAGVAVWPNLDLRLSIGAHRTASGLIPILGFGFSCYATAEIVDDYLPFPASGGLKAHVSAGLEIEEQSGDDFPYLTEINEVHKSRYLVAGYTTSENTSPQADQRLKSVLFGIGVGLSDNDALSARYQLQIPWGYIPWPRKERRLLAQALAAESAFLLALSRFDFPAAFTAIRTVDRALDQLSGILKMDRSTGAATELHSLHPATSVSALLNHAQTRHEQGLLSRCLKALSVASRLSEQAP